MSNIYLQHGFNLSGKFFTSLLQRKELKEGVQLSYYIVDMSNIYLQHGFNLSGKFFTSLL